MSNPDPGTGRAESRDFGIQPLDRFLEEAGIANHELVDASTEQLTHKQVQKARRGRRITPNIRGKIRRALVAVLDHRGEPRDVVDTELFNYPS